jgi:hypothetical protein
MSTSQDKSLSDKLRKERRERKKGKRQGSEAARNHHAFLATMPIRSPAEVLSIAKASRSIEPDEPHASPSFLVEPGDRSSEGRQGVDAMGSESNAIERV